MLQKQGGRCFKYEVGGLARLAKWRHSIRAATARTPSCLLQSSSFRPRVGCCPCFVFDRTWEDRRGEDPVRIFISIAVDSQ